MGKWNTRQVGGFATMSHLPIQGVWDIFLLLLKFADLSKRNMPLQNKYFPRFSVLESKTVQRYCFFTRYANINISFLNFFLFFVDIYGAVVNERAGLLGL